jgi:hypothetical protein
VNRTTLVSSALAPTQTWHTQHTPLHSQHPSTCHPASSGPHSPCLLCSLSALPGPDFSDLCSILVSRSFARPFLPYWRGTEATHSHTLCPVQCRRKCFHGLGFLACPSCAHLGSLGLTALSLSSQVHCLKMPDAQMEISRVPPGLPSLPLCHLMPRKHV